LFSTSTINLIPILGYGSDFGFEIIANLLHYELLKLCFILNVALNVVAQQLCDMVGL
jgi:hypothetical protein